MNWLNPILSVANGVAQYFGAREQRDWEERQADTQFERNKEIMALQNQYNVENFERELQANSAEGMLERGLNPLWSGQNAGSISPVSALGYDRASARGMANPIAAGAEGVMQMAQYEQLKALTEKTKSETKNIEAKLPFEIDQLRANVRSSNASAEAQETINKYIDAQQEAELRMKDASVAQADAAVKKALAEISKMDYEKATMMISWLETQEKILNLQKQRELTDKQIDELASLIRLNDANAKKIGLDIQNYDDIQVIGIASSAMSFGPIRVQEGQPITLAMQKAARAQQEKERAKEKKDKDKSWRDIKDEYPE